MKKALTLAVLYTFPLVAFAQTPTNLIGLISFAGDVANRLIPLLIAAALVVFFWGVIVYVAKGDPKAGTPIIIAGLIGLFVMVSVWGIIRIAQNTLGVSNSGANIGNTIPNVPQYQR